MRRQEICTIFTIFALLLYTPALFHGTAYCDEGKYPIKPIKVFVPWGAGGGTDIGARITTSVIPEFLGQPAVIVNRPGGSGSICIDHIMKSKPDGYTMLYSSIGASLLYPAMNTTLPFKYDDPTYIVMTVQTPYMLVVGQHTPWKTFQEFTDALKGNPGKYKYSTAGVGTSQHLCPANIIQKIGLPLTAAKAVHYDSSGAAALALMQGEVDFLVNNVATTSGGIESGKFRALAVLTEERIKEYQDVPTVVELGFPEMVYSSFQCIGGPPGLPGNVIKVWEEAFKKTRESRPWKKMTTNSGQMPAPAKYLDHKEFTKFLDKEFIKYRKIFEELGLLIAEKK